MFEVKSYFYREHRIDLHPYAGGFKAFIFPPGGSGKGFDNSPTVAAPDGGEQAARRKILQDCRRFIDRLIAKRVR